MNKLLKGLDISCLGQHLSVLHITVSFPPNIENKNYKRHINKLFTYLDPFNKSKNP